MRMCLGGYAHRALLEFHRVLKPDGLVMIGGASSPDCNHCTRCQNSIKTHVYSSVPRKSLHVKGVTVLTYRTMCSAKAGKGRRSAFD